ncbi:MAG: hypothetical protein IT366_21375 [Candidatus Hydrogenedentes bacterium]|nr:hypothetical protein [Candidatus Hydrogenedentota bacterium]
MAGLIQEPSGCGPGIPRPADTPQEGVRSVRASKSEHEQILGLRYLVSLLRIALKADVVDWPEVARTFQKGADVAGVLSHHYRGRDRAATGQEGAFAGEVQSDSHAAHAAQGGGR